MKKDTRHAMVARKIVKDINTGIFAPGQKLPSETELAEKLKVSRATVRLALENLSRRDVVEKIRGRGTYVMPSAARGGYITVLAAGPGARHALFVAALIPQCEKRAREMGLKTAITYAGKNEEALAVAREIGADPGAAGGILVGHLAREQAAALAAAAGGKLVMIGDFDEAARAEPVMDQIIGAHYQCIREAACYLLQNGVRHPAMFQEDTPCVWTTEAISAFRSVFDMAGMDVSRQEVVAMPNEFPAGSDSPNSMEELEECARRTILDKFHAWKMRNDWPDGIIINRDTLALLMACMNEDDEVGQHLAHSRFAVRVFDDHLRMVPPHGHKLDIRWIVYSVKELVDLAFSRLQDRDRPGGPLRLYARKCFLL